MAQKKVSEKVKDQESTASVEQSECFIIMPIADRDGYETGHFKRVYDWIVKPACEKAGYKPVRADDVSSSHFIVADILKRIVEAPMAICDISSLNANVMFELGIRQAFGKPVALIKDEKTSSVFDISGLRYSEYSSGMRADLVEKNVELLSDMICETRDDLGSITSLMSLVDIDAAVLPKRTEVSEDSKLILQEIHNLSRRIGRIEGPNDGYKSGALDALMRSKRNRVLHNIIDKSDDSSFEGANLESLDYYISEVGFVDENGKTVMKPSKKSVKVRDVG
ncbi:hypothetical protein [Amphritea balenae]|uniref:Uncharacterized protein n=1 Tax=Amphritea balenae TaxID=452629 RepID=A0A3P1SMZ5_9GAMM|nr:hypothetical protein [Amphritea balenae]RRC97622.1 hypothetical protein EHS89_17475 [Amphritea balenae]GGK73600.1 hypothetical protein GCM10007941_24560 [Amphritea balenae]